MLHALFWFPLLAVFFWLAWAGWNEYQKLEAYRLWATQFEQAKYDIYAVLGQQGSDLTWGLPTRKGPINLETFSLRQVRSLRFLVNDQPADLASPPNTGRAALEFTCENRPEAVKIPFTEPALAAKWGQYLEKVKGRKEDGGAAESQDE